MAKRQEQTELIRHFLLSSSPDTFTWLFSFDATNTGLFFSGFIEQADLQITWQIQIFHTIIS